MNESKIPFGLADKIAETIANNTSFSKKGVSDLIAEFNSIDIPLAGLFMSTLNLTPAREACLAIQHGMKPAFQTDSTTSDDMKTLNARYPNLTNEGLATPFIKGDAASILAARKEDQEEHNRSIQAIDATRQWIRQNCDFRKTMNKRITSYGIKHIIENSIATYLSNGVCIAAFLLEEGYRMEPESPTSPNCHFNVKFL